MDPKNGERKKKLPSKGLQSSSIKFPSNVWYASLPITKKYNKICVNSLLEVIKTLLQIIIFALLKKFLNSYYNRAILQLRHNRIKFT